MHTEKATLARNQVALRATIKHATSKAVKSFALQIPGFVMAYDELDDKIQNSSKIKKELKGLLKSYLSR